MHIRSAAFAVLVCSIACGSLASGRGEDVGPLVPSRQIWTCHYIATTPKGPLPITARFEVLGEELAEIETIPENLNFSEKYKVLENNETDIVAAISITKLGDPPPPGIGAFLRRLWRIAPAPPFRTRTAFARLAAS
jgi:hypothetical protein